MSNLERMINEMGEELGIDAAKARRIIRFFSNHLFDRLIEDGEAEIPNLCMLRMIYSPETKTSHPVTGNPHTIPPTFKIFARVKKEIKTYFKEIAKDKSV